MNKYLISFILVFNSLLLAKYEDNNPTLTTKKDLELLKNFESLLYKNTKINDFQCDQNMILNFIINNKIETFDYNKLIIKLNGQINNSENYSDENGTLQDRDKANIQITATYPLYDQKTDFEIKKKVIDFRSVLITNISEYCSLKNDLSVLKNLIDLLNLKQIRAKAREDTGQIYLDDRITLIEEIITKKNELNKLTIEYNTSKLKLLNYVLDSKKDDLDKLL